MILQGGPPFPFPVQQPPTSTVSCLACRCAKKFCDRNTPCGRCHRLQIECVPQARGRSRVGQAARQSLARPPGVPRPVVYASAAPDCLQREMGQGDRAYPALLAACLGLLKVSGTNWGEGLLWRRVAPDLRPELAVSKATVITTAALAYLWRSGKLDKKKGDYIRMHMEYMQVFSQHSVEARELFSVLQDVSVHGAQSTSPKSVSLRDALIAQQPHRGKEWAEETCSTADAWSIIFEIGVAQVEVICGLQMGQRCVTSEEFRLRAAELRQLPPLVLATYLSAESIEPFYEAMSHCMYMHANHLERNVVVDVCDRDGILHQCLATIRSHWHVNKALLTVRFWHMASLAQLIHAQPFGRGEAPTSFGFPLSAPSGAPHWINGAEGRGDLHKSLSYSSPTSV